MPIEYNPSASYLGTALSLTSSVVPAVLSRPTFWIFFILHLVVWTLYGREEVEFFEEARKHNATSSMSWHVVKVIVSMTTFFEVFYTNHVYTRYLACYDSVKILFSAEINLFMEMRFHYKQKDLHWARLITRYAVAAVFVFLWDMESEDMVSREEWSEMLRMGLIREEEIEHLEQYNRRHCSAVLLHWAARVVQESTKTMGLTSNIMRCLLAHLLRVRETSQILLDTISLPVPFQYFHLLNVMIVVNLGIWAYGFGIMQSMFAPVGFFFTEIIFCGLMEMAAQLTDPFGTDDVDLPVRDYLLQHWNNSIFVIEKCKAPEQGTEEMLALVSCADKMGKQGKQSKLAPMEASPSNGYNSGIEEDDDDDDD